MPLSQNKIRFMIYNSLEIIVLILGVVILRERVLKSFLFPVQWNVMNTLFDVANFVFAQGEPLPPESPNGTPLPFYIMIGGFLVLMYFLMVFPQKKERDRWNKLLASLKKNDRVLLHNGIIGIVHSIEKEKGELVLKVDEATNTKMTFTLTSIARILDSTEWFFGLFFNICFLPISIFDFKSFRIALYDAEQLFHTK